MFDKLLPQCPVSMVTDGELVEAIGMVNIAEGGGMGGSRVFVSQLIEEPAFYFNIRSIIVGEQSRIEKWKDKVKAEQEKSKR